MKYYLIIVGGKIVDASTEIHYVYWQEKNRIWIDCDEGHADGIVSSSGESIYLIGWKAVSGYEIADIREVDEETYTQAREELDEEGEIVIPDEDPEPEEHPQTRLSILEEQVEKLRQDNSMLMECILEMSEVVYG